MRWGGVLTAPVRSGDPRRLELELKEQLQGLAPLCGRRMWLGSASDSRAREATSPAMATRECKRAAPRPRGGSPRSHPEPWPMITCLVGGELMHV